jgi:hypothetical protein
MCSYWLQIILVLQGLALVFSCFIACHDCTSFFLRGAVAFILVPNRIDILSHARKGILVVLKAYRTVMTPLRPIPLPDVELVVHINGCSDSGKMNNRCCSSTVNLKGR